MMRFRLLTTDPFEVSDHKVNEIIIEATKSWRIEDIKRFIETKSRKLVRAIFLGGHRVSADTLTATCPTRMLSWTCDEPGFHIVESASLQCLIERGEGYRVLPALRSLREVNATCSRGPKAMRASSGSGGVYFLKATSTPGSQIFACFKPRDDEPGARNNPNDLARRNGVFPGEAAEREVAAFVLDWNGFCGVPATVLVEAATHTFAKDSQKSLKIGSFQHFVQSAADTVGDFSPHLFSAREVHKIGLMDLRFLNMDRNDSNILVVRNHADEYHLVPIDHGLCFPDHIEVGWCDWVWWDWPQTLVPFDDDTREWVLGLDVEEDITILRRCFSIRPECLRVYRCMVLLLKKGVAAGLNLRDIASVVIRSRDIDEPSAMEKTVTRARELACLMEANTRSKTNPEKGMHKSSSFDGNLSQLDGLNNSVSEDLFFSYVDRLLEDVVAEIIERKSEVMSEQDYNGAWFSASTRSSPSELTKIASPRLLPRGKLSPQNSENSFGASSVPLLALQQ